MREHALERPLDRQVRAERDSKTEPDPRGRAAAARRGCFPLPKRPSARSLKQGEVSLGLSAPESGNASSARKPARSALRLPRRARAPQTRAVSRCRRAARSTETACKTARTTLLVRALTFDMSGRPQTAKLAVGCPLDGGVRSRRHYCTDLNLQEAAVYTIRARSQSTKAR